MFRSLLGAGVVAALLLVSTTVSRSQEPAVYKKIAPPDLENILKGLGLEFQKTPVPGEMAHLLYSFAKKNHRINLHYYDGKDLMLMSAFERLFLKGLRIRAI